MYKLKNEQTGFITLIVCLVLILSAVIALVYLRVVRANN